MKQHVLLAMYLASDATILLLDEPLMDWILLVLVYS